MKKIYKEEDYPLKEILIDEEDKSGIRFISIVGEPAIEMMGYAFGSFQEKEYDFKEVKDQQIIVGPAMIPNKKIARKDSNGDKYYVFFSKDTIRQMLMKFMSSGSNRRANIDHSNKMVDAYFFEYWIVEDPYYDKARMYGFDVPIGTLMVSLKVEDEDFWKEEVRGNGKYGFSIEGLMTEHNYTMSIEDHIDNLTDDDVIKMFNDVNEEILLDFLSKSGKSREGVQFFDSEDLDLPDTQRVYYYDLKPGKEGPMLQDNSREFCKHVVGINKYWTEDDIDELSARLGYNVFEYAGSYQCRHTFKTALVNVSDRPTAGQIDKAVDEQTSAGLAN